MTNQTNRSPFFLENVSDHHDVNFSLEKRVRRPAELEYACPPMLSIQTEWKSCISYASRSCYLRDVAADVFFRFGRDELLKHAEDKYDSIEVAESSDRIVDVAIVWAYLG